MILKILTSLKCFKIELNIAGEYECNLRWNRVGASATRGYYYTQGCHWGMLLYNSQVYQRRPS